MSAPAASSPAVRLRMRRQRSRDTGPELALRAALRRRGVTGYRLHWEVLPRRRADLAWPGRRVAVFVDGCFWHGCPAHSRGTRANAAWWAAKVTRNAARDLDTTERLSRQGWTVLRVWEHADPEAAAREVARAVRAAPQGMR